MPRDAGPRAGRHRPQLVVEHKGATAVDDAADRQRIGDEHVHRPRQRRAAQGTGPAEEARAPAVARVEPRLGDVQLREPASRRAEARQLEEPEDRARARNLPGGVGPGRSASRVEEDRHVGRIVGFELAGLAIEHAALLTPKARIANGEWRILIDYDVESVK